jgi:alpha-amylase
MTYHWNHFSGIDRDMRTNDRGVFKFVGPSKQGWAQDVSEEFGNYDYLCARTERPSVQQRLTLT